MGSSMRPSARQQVFAEIHERVLKAASEQLGVEARFVGSRDWLIFLFGQKYPDVYPPDLDRRQLERFVKQAAGHGLERGLIKPERPPSTRGKSAT